MTGPDDAGPDLTGTPVYDALIEALLGDTPVSLLAPKGPTS